MGIRWIAFAQECGKLTLFFGVFMSLSFSQSPQSIEISKNVIIEWNASSEMLIKNNDYKRIAINFSEYSEEILEALSDTTLTRFKVCGKTTNLRKGDFAWMLLRELRMIPKSCSIRSFDTYGGMCFFPVGLLDYMEENRQEVAQGLKDCVEQE
jgi:hypothetical protein